MATIFQNAEIALFFNQMTLGIMDKFEFTEETAGDWLVEYEGDPERHLVHLIDALIGFMSNPTQKVDVDSISKFIPHVQQLLEKDGCTIDLPHIMEIYRMLQDDCPNEIAAWKKIQVKANKNGVDSIDEEFIDELWATIPDNNGQQYHFE